jgi:hypothetical protein
MNAFDHFCAMVLQLAQIWDLAVDPPVRECSSHFITGNEGEIILRLSDDETVIVVGASLPLSGLCTVRLERHALQLFLLQQTHAARLGSQVRYAWLQEGDRIVLYRDIETGEATAEKIMAVVDNLNARLAALAEAIPVFHQAERAAPVRPGTDIGKFV